MGSLWPARGVGHKQAGLHLGLPLPQASKGPGGTLPADPLPCLPPASPLPLVRIPTP